MALPNVKQLSINPTAAPYDGTISISVGGVGSSVGGFKKNGTTVIFDHNVLAGKGLTNGKEFTVTVFATPGPGSGNAAQHLVFNDGANTQAFFNLGGTAANPTITFQNTGPA